MAPLTAAHLQSQIKRYDAADATAVSPWIRANGSMAQAINQIEEIYVQTVNEHRAMPPIPDEEFIAAADYLLVLARKIKELMSQEWPNAMLKPTGTSLPRSMFAAVRTRAARSTLRAGGCGSAWIR